MSKYKYPAYRRQYYQEHKDEIEEYKRKYNRSHEDEIKEYKRRYYQLHKEELAIYYERYRQSNRGKAREYRQLHKQETREYNQLHKEERREYARKYRNTLKGKLDDRMGTAIYLALKGKKAGRSWERLVGYTLKDLIKHLESKFTDGLTWKKFLNGEYDIDHKKPKSLFRYEKPEDPEFKKCWALENLQPLKTIDNLRKSNHYAESSKTI